MGAYYYNYVMLDRRQFENYERICKKHNIKCAYNQINSNCYGVMIATEKSKSDTKECKRREIE